MFGKCLFTIDRSQPQLLLSAHSFCGGHVMNKLAEFTSHPSESRTMIVWKARKNCSYFHHGDIQRGCRRPSLPYNCCGRRASSARHSSLCLSPPSLMPPRLRVDSASLWQLLITGWPGPAALCMTASRPAQVTRQSERKRGRNRERWRERWLGSAENDRGREKERKEETESGRKNRGGKWGREWWKRQRERQRRIAEGTNGRREREEEWEGGMLGETGTVD